MKPVVFRFVILFYFIDFGENLPNTNFVDRCFVCYATVWIRMHSQASVCCTSSLRCTVVCTSLGSAVCILVYHPCHTFARAWLKIEYACCLHVQEGGEREAAAHKQMHKRRQRESPHTQSRVRHRSGYPCQLVCFRVPQCRWCCAHNTRGVDKGRVWRSVAW